MLKRTARLARITSWLFVNLNLEREEFELIKGEGFNLVSVRR